MKHINHIFNSLNIIGFVETPRKPTIVKLSIRMLVTLSKKSGLYDGPDRKPNINFSRGINWS